MACAVEFIVNLFAGQTVLRKSGTWWNSLPGVGLLALALWSVSGCRDPQSPTEKADQPRLVVDNPVHEFGEMMIGEERQHTFLLRNTGTAPLTLIRSNQSCSCFKLKLKSFEIPPGGAEEATVTWDVKMPREFLEKLVFDTNDPEHPQFELQFKGRVMKLVEIEPGMLNAGMLSEDTPAEVVGNLLSYFEKFEISSIDCSNPQITAEAERWTEDELAQRQAKSGYRVRVKIPPLTVPPGPFREFVTVHTSVNGGTPFKIELQANRPGPIQISGPSFDPKLLYLELRSFSAKVGKLGRLNLRATGMTEEFHFLEVQPDDERLEVTLEPNAEVSGLFRLNVRIKPGLPPAARTGPNAAIVRVKTNHPRAPNLKFYVDFVTTP